MTTVACLQYLCQCRSILRRGRDPDSRCYERAKNLREGVSSAVGIPTPVIFGSISITGFNQQRSKCSSNFLRFWNRSSLSHILYRTICFWCFTRIFMLVGVLSRRELKSTLRSVPFLFLSLPFFLCRVVKSQASRVFCRS